MRAKGKAREEPNPTAKRNRRDCNTTCGITE